jgi:hypothetical protein
LNNSTVIPAKLAIASASRNPGFPRVPDSRFRGNDEKAHQSNLFIEL